MGYFIIISLLILSIFLLYENLKKNNLEKVNKTELEKLKREEWETRKKVELEREKLVELKRESKERAQDYYNSEIATCNVKIELEKSKIDSVIESLRKEFEKEKATMEVEFQDFLKFQLERKAKIENEINEASARRDAVIEVERKEEERKLEKDFYRLQLSLEDIEDIKKLLPLSEKLSKPEILQKLIWSTYYQPAFNKLLSRALPQTTSGIYKITNLDNGKIYIGKSVNIKERWSQHIKSYLGIGTIAKTQLYEGMRESGGWNFTFELLEEVPKEKLNEREKFYISFYKTNSWGYNETAGG